MYVYTGIYVYSEIYVCMYVCMYMDMYMYDTSDTWGSQAIYVNTLNVEACHRYYPCHTYIHIYIHTYIKKLLEFKNIKNNNNIELLLTSLVDLTPGY